MGGSGTVEVTLDPGNKLADAILEHDVSDGLARALAAANASYIDELSSEHACELTTILALGETAAREAVEAFKYFLGKTRIADDVIGPCTKARWSQDGTHFHPCPGRINTTLHVSTELPFSEMTRELLQEAISNGYRPLLGERHLYRAIQESVPRFKWIDATVAAELAVKEALVRTRPELEMLIINLPSPPLSKLYGDILQTYLGQRSPKLKAINEGMEIRNKLIHRPQSEDVSADKAYAYVSDIAQAIHHLYVLLYPEWDLGKHLLPVRPRG